MATPDQINALIAFILGLGPTVSGEDGLLGAVEDGIVDSLFDLPREEAIQAARDRAAALREILRFADAKRIAAIIVDTLENGKSFDEAVRRIRENIGLLDSQDKALEKLRAQLEEEGRDALSIAERLASERERLLQERAANIANTEIANATEEGNLRNALARGATHKVNIDAADERVSRICQACTAQGLIDINEPFASGAQRPQHHNNCRCTAAFFTDPSQARIDRINARAEARLEQTNQGQEASEEELAQAET